MNKMNFDEAKKIMNDNIIGPNELSKICKMKFDFSDYSPEIPFSKEEIMMKSHDYLLIYGASRFYNGLPVTIRNFKKIFGTNPDNEPCFYFQDWYDNEKFIDIQMREGWFFIRKKVYENSRAIQPEQLLKNYSFPSAILCTYSFFVTWFVLNEKLWYHDFVWCSDFDHNGDRIYVGKYNDIDGINKNGFSIHRHLALRSCYACID